MKIEAIEEAFFREGYVSIPFTFNAAGHPVVKARFAGGVEANILLDTGASIDLLDDEFARQLGLTLTPTGENASGAGGLSYDVFDLGGLSFEIGGQRFKFDAFYSMDFASIKEALTSHGVAEELQGILGVGFFKMTKCFIDYSADRIFILNNDAPS
jgi:hypothetical protein